MPERKRTIAFIAGSGLARGLEGVLENVQEREREIIPEEFRMSVRYFTGDHRDIRVIILPRHGKPRSNGDPEFSPAELVSTRRYEANIWHLHNEGVEAIYAFSAVGCLDLDVPLASKGYFVVPHSYVRGLAASQHSFGTYATHVHSNMSSPFDEQLRQIAIQAITDSGYKALDSGLYIYNGGDQFETNEEIEFLCRMTEGQSRRLVGMTTVPEAILSKQMGIPYVVICSNVNFAQGLSSTTPAEHGQTTDVMAVASPFITQIVERIIQNNYS